MAQNNQNILLQIDFWILDHIFQPIADRLPGDRPNVGLGLNLLLGAVIFSIVFLVLPLILFDTGFFFSTYNFLSCILTVCFYMFVHRSQAMISDKFMNPLRYHLFGARILGLPFAFYGIYIWLNSWGYFSKITLFYCISNILSICGLYFVSCNVNPPRYKKPKTQLSESPFS
ncbi:hypothetical protein [Commensalibacter oyaizuii]|uniref:Uncharacterized protein n=1 Tax=Commensalibacter oyaizuii TaxID=3043873 RepID=A0ABT6PY83_9PROT|nr:hypothetical protein [Commensalibacter sp. TBRC 16381]MDI2089825.1 hypothetical protein [Commensalibacter sp. TBRC 16381]